MKHGTYGSYTSGCRCGDCRRANRDYQRRRRNSNAPARAYDRWQKATYNTAERILRERHRDEFEQILADVRENNAVAS